MTQGITSYVEGSVSGKGSESSVYSSGANINVSILLGKHTSVFQVEMFALIECVTKCMQKANLHFHK